MQRPSTVRGQGLCANCTKDLGQRSEVLLPQLLHCWSPARQGGWADWAPQPLSLPPSALRHRLS